MRENVGFYILNMLCSAYRFTRTENRHNITHTDDTIYSNDETSLDCASHVWLQNDASEHRSTPTCGQPTELSIITYQLCTKIASPRWSLECSSCPKMHFRHRHYIYIYTGTNERDLRWAGWAEPFGLYVRRKCGQIIRKENMVKTVVYGTKLAASVYLCVFRRLFGCTTTAKTKTAHGSWNFSARGECAKGYEFTVSQS